MACMVRYMIFKEERIGYVINRASTDDICTVTSIRELIDERDTHNTFDTSHTSDIQ